MTTASSDRATLLGLNKLGVPGCSTENIFEQLDTR